MVSGAERQRWVGWFEWAFSPGLRAAADDRSHAGAFGGRSSEERRSSGGRAAEPDVRRLCRSPVALPPHRLGSADEAASDAEKARLNDTFAALCRIPSSFGSERACADHVAALLRAMGLEVAEDDAAAAAGAECGNLLARIPGRGERSILLCAHLDTVDDGGVPIEPVVVDGGWENANAGILGADNKAAVAVMLELARRCSVEGSPVGLELLFTVSEENALAGRQGVRRERPAVRLRLRLRPRDPDRRGRHGVADLLPHRRRLPRPRRPRRHPPRGRPLGDPRRRARDRRDAARADRRADDRQRRLDPGRRRLHQHRPGALPAAGRDPLARPRAGRGRGGEPRRRHPRRRRPRRVRRRRHLRAAVRRLPRQARRARGAGRRGGAARVRLRAAPDRHRRRLGRQRARVAPACRA